MKVGFKRFMALFLALVILTGMLGGLPAQAADGAVTIDVSQYFEGSHEVDGIKEATTAVERALEYAATLPAETPKIISFPKGEYHFYADYAPEREYYVSNTAGINQSLKMKRVGILVEDMENVTIDGGGSSFIYHGNITTFAAVRSKNVLFTNYEFDHASPSVVDVTVESKVKGENAVIAYIPPAYTYEISGTTITWKGEESPVTGQPYWQGNNGLAHQQGLDTLEGKKNGGGQSALFSGVTKIEDLGGGRVKITYSGSTPKVGYCFQMRNTTRVTPGVFIWESENVTLKDLGAHFLHGFGLVAQLSKNITIDNVDFLAKPGTGRTTASFADFLQMSSVGGKIVIKNCDFANPQDDPINIHGTFLIVKEISNDNKTFLLQYQHNETGGFPQYYVGDEVDFSAMGSMLPVTDSKRTVMDVENFPGGNRNQIRITLDRSVNGITANNSHVVENVTYTPEVLIQNNRFIETPTRGILVTTRKPVVIENNYFDAMGMASIFISCDASYPYGWFESGHTENVVIRNNVFDRLSAGSGAIFVEPTGTASRSDQVHSNMLIEENIFNLEGNVPVVNAKSVKNLTIQNNIINRMNPDVSLELTADQETVAAGGIQATALAKSGAQRTGSLYKLYGCVDVSIKNNIYDAGLNQIVELGSGTLSTDVTVVGDDLKVNNGNNQKPAVDKVLYFSTNPAVAAVDENGVVTGVNEGTADIFAYTVSGARVFESNRLTFTVSGISGGEEEAPASITVSTPEDKIDVGDTLQFSAVTDPAEQAITWSVRDAATLNATDVASIDASSGLLTAAKAGVVEVLATSDADGEVYDSKLITVRVPDGGKGEAWAVREDKGTWTINDDGTLTILAQKGGDWATGKAASNIFLTDPPEGDFSFTVELKNKTVANYEEAGLVVYQDHDNYVALERKNNGGNRVLAVVTETNGSPNEDESGRPSDITADNIFFKLEKSGNVCTGYYSEDGQDWIKIREVTNTTLGDDFQIGVIACNVDSGANPPYTFANFEVDDTPVPFLSTNQEPGATGAAITTEGTTLTLNYTFTDPDGDTEGDSLFAWCAADSENGIYRRVDGADSATLAVTPDLSGKYVKAALVPVDQGGRMGAPVYALAVQAPEVAGDQTDATLRALEIPGVALSPAFAGGVTAYSAMLPASAGTLTVIAQASQPDAEVAVEQTDDEITVTVTAPNGTDTKIYTVALARAKDSSSALEKLDLTGGASLSLEGDSRYYQLLVDSDVETLQLETAAASDKASLEVRFNYEVLNDYASAEGTYPLTLVGGLNFVEVRTLAEDGISSRIYRVAIMKTPSDQAGLASLKVNGASVPGFDSEKETYHLDVQAGPVTFTAAAKSDKAKVEYFLNGVSATGSAELSDHLTTLTVKVTAENTSTVRTYTVHLVIPAADSTDLISFSTGGVALTPAFDPAVTAYTASVTSQTLPLSVLAVEGKALITAETDSAFFRGVGRLDATVPLKDGENILAVAVTSPDGTATKTYTLTVTKTNSVYLSDLEWVSATTGDSSYNGGQPVKDSGWEGYELSLIGSAGEKVPFSKGIGTHAGSSIVYDLTDKGYETFAAKIGVSYKKYGSDEPHLTFKIIGDGKTLYTSKTMEGRTPFESISVDIKGVKTLTLEVTQPSNVWSAHGNWADAKFTSASAEPAAQHAVTVTEAEHAVLWAERKLAAEGETVTVHLDDIADGYRFASLSVKSADGTEVETIAVETGKVYTFTMPAQAVTVSAQTELIPTTSSGGGSNTTTTVKNNPDGSTTTTVTNKRTGTVTVTTKYKDGVTIQTVTPKSGDSVSTVKLPSGVEKASVVIPAKDVTPGTVAVIIKADGTQEIVKSSVAVDGGVKVTLTGGAQLKLIDNAKSFADVAADHWAADAVQFVASRELFQGNGSGFAPAGTMTRGMLMTVLYRLEGANVASGGDKWYSDALAWSKEQGLSDGTNPEADITRESLAVMLYRYAGEPKTEGESKTFSDSASISGWAAEAMDWAVKSGIVTGKSGNLLDPAGTATRAEVAAMLQRFMIGQAK